MSNQHYWTEIVGILLERGLTIATMESCTGGGIANVITNVSGASAAFAEGYVTYSNEAKIKQGVQRDVIETYTVYSEETAIQMAQVVKYNAKTDIGVGITGQLGRIDPNNPVDCLNVAWFAIIGENDEIHTRKIQVPDFERDEQKDYIINAVARALLDLIRY